MYFRIVYSDGDVEDLTETELLTLLAQQGTTAASAISAAADVEVAELFGEGNELLSLDPPSLDVQNDLDDFVALAAVASFNVSVQSSDAKSELPHGETYNCSAGAQSCSH